MPLTRSMSDPGALVCVRRGERPTPSAQRWQRRGRDAHPGLVLPARPNPPRVARRGRAFAALRALLGAAVFAGVAWCGVTMAMTHAGDAAFARRIAAGCEDLEPCLSLEAEAERRMDGCTLACGRAAAEHRAARLMRFHAEERRAVREHYRERDRAEQQERDSERARQLDDWRRRESAHAEEAERERRHQLELERLRQAEVERRLAEQRARRQSYYAALGAEGRTKRLEHCLAGSERCDALVLDLLEAARDDSERRQLAELNEGVTHPPPKAARAAKARAQEPSADSAPDDPTSSSAPASPVSLGPRAARSPRS